MSGIGLADAYKLPDQTAAGRLDASVRRQPAAPGIGLTASADNDGGLPVPDGSNVVQPQLTAPPALDPASLVKTTTPPAAPAPVAEPPLIDFHKNPLGAIGLVLSSVAAGMNGTESPVAQLKQQKLQEQAQQYKTAALAMDVVEKTSTFVSKLPAGQRAAAIADLDKRFSPALGGHSIGGFLTAITAGTAEKSAATLQAIKELNVSPATMAYFSANPDAAIKFLDDYNVHKASQETPAEAAAKAKAVTEANNSANATKPLTPYEQAQIDAGATTEAEVRRHNQVSEGQSANKPMTDAQSNSALFADRAHEAEAVLSKYGSVLASAKGRVLDNVPGGNAAQSADYQKASQAKTNFLMAILRKESGAAIGKDEIATGDKQYFPQFGDTKDTIAQKARNRATALAGIARGAGPSYKPPQTVIQYDAKGNPL